MLFGFILLLLLLTSSPALEKSLWRNWRVILKVIETLFRYREVSTTSGLGLVSNGIDTK